MNKIIYLILTTLFLGNFSLDSKAQCNEQLTNSCALSVGDNATYIRDFPAKLKRKKRNEPTPYVKFTVVLNKGTQYRFSICNATEFEGEGVLQLFDTNRIQGSTFDIAKGIDYGAFDFICQKTAVYQVFISFKDGEEGCAVGILSIVR